MKWGTGHGTETGDGVQLEPGQREGHLGTMAGVPRPRGTPVSGCGPGCPDRAGVEEAGGQAGGGGISTRPQRLWQELMISEEGM